MVIDSSALLAILTNEPERRAFNEAIQAAESRLLSAATFVEVSIVIESRFGPSGLRDLDLFIEKAGIDVTAVDREQATMARQAFRWFCPASDRESRKPSRWPVAAKAGEVTSSSATRTESKSLLRVIVPSFR